MEDGLQGGPEAEDGQEAGTTQAERRAAPRDTATGHLSPLVPRHCQPSFPVMFPEVEKIYSDM